MPNTHTTLTALFTDIADAIRAKTGDTASIRADDFPAAIVSITGGCARGEPTTVFDFAALLAQGFGWTNTATSE